MRDYNKASLGWLLWDPLFILLTLKISNIGLHLLNPSEDIANLSPVPPKKPTPGQHQSLDHPVPHISANQYPPNCSNQIPGPQMEGPKLLKAK